MNADLVRTEHDFRDLSYRVRVEVVAEIVDSRTGEVVLAGEEDETKRLYRALKKGGDGC